MPLKKRCGGCKNKSKNLHFCSNFNCPFKDLTFCGNCLLRGRCSSCKPGRCSQCQQLMNSGLETCSGCRLLLCMDCEDDHCDKFNTALSFINWAKNVNLDDSE